MTVDGRQPHILVINDTQEILDLMGELLEDEGYRATTSLALLDIDKVKALTPDVIVQDLLFEGTQELGWKFLTLVRLDPELARIPIILCTAAVRTVNDPEMAEHLDRLGVRVLLKPFLIEDLLTALSEVLTAQSLIQQAADGEERWRAFDDFWEPARAAPGSLRDAAALDAHLLADGRVALLGTAADRAATWHVQILGRTPHEGCVVRVEVAVRRGCQGDRANDDPATLPPWAQRIATLSPRAPQARSE